MPGTLPGPPEIVTNLDQRLTAKLSDLAAKIDNLERTRPMTAVGAGPPDDATVANGAVRYMDRVGRRFYVYANNQWISADSQRYTVSASNTATIGNGTVSDTGWVPIGPSLTLYASAPAILHVYIDAWVGGNAWGTGFLTNALFGYQLDGTSQVQSGQNGVYNASSHRVSSSANSTTAPTGNDFPRGAFQLVQVSEGEHTLDFVGRAVSFDTPVQVAQAVTFQGRSIRVLIL
jgi:hypothetical protein